MKIKTFIRAFALTGCFMFSVAASADLATDLQNLSPEQAVELALQQEGVNVLEVMAQVAEILQSQPEALAQAVAAAVKANPTLATQIVFTVVQIAPAQKTVVAQAAAAEVSDPAIQAAISQVADQAVAQQLAGAPGSKGDGDVVETEAEQTEAPPQDTTVVIPLPPTVPPSQPPSQPPTSVSPS